MKYNSKKYPRAKKSLGQNFLVDQNVIRNIVDIIDPKENEKIIEIGPGQGAITKLLAESGCQLTCIEFDTDFAEKLTEEFASFKNVQIIEADILRYDWKEILPVTKVVGNLPYNISSQVLFKMFESHQAIEKSVFMVQKEFGERLVASPRTKDYGIMTVFSRFYGEAKHELAISPQVFRPVPRVDSSLMSFEFFKKTDPRVEYLAAFHSFVRTAFNQRRKTIKNSLRFYYHTDFEEKFDWTLRADAIKPEEFVDLFSVIMQHPEFEKMKNNDNKVMTN